MSSNPGTFALTYGKRPSDDTTINFELSESFPEELHTELIPFG